MNNSKTPFNDKICEKTLPSKLRQNSQFTDNLIEMEIFFLKVRIIVNLTL